MTRSPDPIYTGFSHAEAFLNLLERLFRRETIDLDHPAVSLAFEIIPTNLLPQSSLAVDGATGLSAKIRKPRQMDFTGKMWIIGDGPDRMEPIHLRVTDKRITKQGISLRLQLGEHEAVGTLDQAFGIAGGQNFEHL